MSELLNHNELAAIVTSAPVTDGHAALLDALHGRYPSVGFRLVGERKGRTWQPGIIDREGNRVTDSLGKWLDEQLATCGGNAREVWNRYKNAALIRTEWSGSVIYLTAPYGSGPDTYFQLEVLVGEEVLPDRCLIPAHGQRRQIGLTWFPGGCGLMRRNNAFSHRQDTNLTPSSTSENTFGSCWMSRWRTSCLNSQSWKRR